jgi:hypothetical protein
MRDPVLAAHAIEHHLDLVGAETLRETSPLPVRTSSGRRSRIEALEDLAHRPGVARSTNSAATQKRL